MHHWSRQPLHTLISMPTEDTHHRHPIGLYLHADRGRHHRHPIGGRNCRISKRMNDKVAAKITETVVDGIPDISQVGSLLSPVLYNANEPTWHQLQSYFPLDNDFKGHIYMASTRITFTWPRKPTLTVLSSFGDLLRWWVERKHHVRQASQPQKKENYTSIYKHVQRE